MTYNGTRWRANKVKEIDSETKITDPGNAMLVTQGDGSFEYRV